MKKFLKTSLLAITPLFFLSPEYNALHAETAVQEQTSGWFQQEASDINKAVNDYLQNVSLAPHIQKNGVKFTLEAFEANSGTDNLAFPIGKITDGTKSYYGMFIVGKQTGAQSPYKVQLLSLSTEQPPSVILLIDVLRQVVLLNELKGTKFDNAKLLIERLKTSDDKKTFYSKWTLFDGSTSASFYVTTTTDAKGETDFSVTETPFSF